MKSANTTKTTGPGQAARAYLTVIACDTEAVRKALEPQDAG